MDYSSQIAVVTGGAGFVGSRLCRRLQELGMRVISLDNYFTGSTDHHVPGVEYRIGHTRDIARHIPERPTIVYHLGEYSRVEKSFEDPIELVWDMNIAGTFSVLEYCRAQDAKLVYAGSSTKFADGGAGRSQSPYAWTKATNTELVKNYGDWFGLRYAIAYFYNVYGEGEIASGPYSTAIGIFKEEYRRGLPITVVSPGTQTRCFTHISDIVSGLTLIGERGEGDGYDIGNERAYSMLEVAGFFSTEIVMLPERKGNRLESSVHSTKLRELGWEPTISLEEHIHQFTASCKREPLTERRVLVFSTTYDPVEGPAEIALRKVVQALPDVQFDVLTTRYDKNRERTVHSLPNVTVYRLGSGNRWDKYRLPYAAWKKAQELCQSHRYVFGWSVMASYAGFAASLWRRGEGHTPLLISLADQRLDRLPFLFRAILRFTLQRADQLSTSLPMQDSHVSRVSSRIALTRSNQQGDPFANQIRFLYNDILRKEL